MDFDFLDNNGGIWTNFEWMTLDKIFQKGGNKNKTFQNINYNLELKGKQ